MSGARIIKAIEEAARGDFSRVTTHGHVWIRDGVDKAEAWDAISEKNAEIERLRAQLASARKALEEYGQHTVHCDYDRPGDPKCSCGFSDEISALTDEEGRNCDMCGEPRDGRDHSECAKLPY